MKHVRLVEAIIGLASAVFLSGCVTSGQVAIQPAARPVRPGVVVASAPPPRPVVAAPGSAEMILPEPNDVYVSAALNRDVVFVNGNTYIWVTGSDGRRHRHFYEHGDRRQEVFLRRENLRSVAARRTDHPSRSDQRVSDRRNRDEIGHPHPLHTADMRDHHSPASPHATVNGPSSHNARHQPGHSQGQSYREASNEHNGARHRPNPGGSPATTETRSRS